MEKPFQRPLSISERLWLSVNAICPPYVNQLVSAGRGTIDLKDLQHAVEKASQANPGSRLILKGNLHKAYWLDSGITPPVRFITGKGWDGYDREAAPYLQTLLPYSGPTCEVVFVPGDISHVIVRSNHGVMDAGGTVTWAEDIYRVLRGEEPLGSSSTMTDAALTRQFSSATKKMSTLKCIAPTGKAQPGPTGITWKRLSFTGKHSKVMGKVAIALARSAWKYGTGTFQMAIPVDLRMRQPDLRSTGNLSMAIYVTVTPDSTPESITDDVRRQLLGCEDCVLVEGGDHLDLVPLWLMQFGLKMVFKWQHLRGHYPVSALVSYVSRLDVRRFCGGGFITETCFGIPPGMEGFPAFVGVGSTLDNRIEVVVSVPNVLASNGRLDQLAQDISAVFS